ncbi:hypothetical protein [Corynebacterium casei]|nr:hypothetical protein [Corynebacterium casei]SLM89129.1 hypothetical protein CZ765_05255 [Corynebacterium casei]
MSDINPLTAINSSNNTVQRATSDYAVDAESVFSSENHGILELRLPN